MKGIKRGSRREIEFIRERNHIWDTKGRGIVFPPPLLECILNGYEEATPGYSQTWGLRFGVQIFFSRSLALLRGIRKFCFIRRISSLSFSFTQPQDRYALYMQREVYAYFHGKYIHVNCKGKIRFRATFKIDTIMLCLSMCQFVTILPHKQAKVSSTTSTHISYSFPNIHFHNG
jgi:hypothetical protein